MKNLFALTTLSAFALTLTTSSLPSSALDGDDHARAAAKNERRAENQEFKAQRDAARGNVVGAERHADNAALDDHKARHDEHVAKRDARRGW